MALFACNKVWFSHDETRHLGLLGSFNFVLFPVVDHICLFCAVILDQSNSLNHVHHIKLKLETNLFYCIPHLKESCGMSLSETLHLLIGSGST